MLFFFFFFFKQKTAYEMCGRDWSSDVCSSDLTTSTSCHTTLLKQTIQSPRGPMEAPRHPQLLRCTISNKCQRTCKNQHHDLDLDCVPMSRIHSLASSKLVCSYTCDMKIIVYFAIVNVLSFGVRKPSIN